MVGGMEFCSSAHEDEVVADGKGHETKRANEDNHGGNDTGDEHE